MLGIVEEIRSPYPKKKFTLDGRLVGDLEECLVENVYNLERFEGLRKHHDVKTPDEKYLQIKATMKRSLTFPGNHVTNYYLGIQIHQDGTFTEIFNGPGSIAVAVIEGRKPIKNNQDSISIAALKKLNEKVKSSERIPKRVTNLS